MKLYDTSKKMYQNFEPEHIVRIYVCGITPYDSAHLGHIFTFMMYDLLQRRLEDLGHEVQMVRNVTDVDEPIYVKAKELGVHYTELARRELRSFRKTLKLLNFRPLFAEPLASQYISQMIEAVHKLMESGHAYYVDKDIYYDVATDNHFGAFSGYNKRLQLAFMNSRGGDPSRPGKRQPLDFLLWKSVSDPNDPARWSSPFGPGRPGWHIECSVMSGQLLGLPFDLHGGGTDLIFPHHECEVAQNHGLGFAQTAHHWMHVSPLLYEGEKMSKSLGNLVFAKDLLNQYDFATIRLALMFYHYRVGGEWQNELLDRAQQLLHAIEMTASHASSTQTTALSAEVRAALDDDINTVRVVEALERFAYRKKDTGSHSDAQAVVGTTLALLGLKH